MASTLLAASAADALPFAGSSAWDQAAPRGRLRVPKALLAPQHCETSTMCADNAVGAHGVCNATGCNRSLSGLRTLLCDGTGRLEARELGRAPAAWHTAAWWTTFWHPHELVADELSLPLEENEFCLTLCSASQRFRALQYEPSHVEQLAMSAEHESSDVSPVNVAAGMQCAAGGARASEVHIECIGANSAAAFASTRCANEAVDRLRAPRDCQARARCVRWKT